QLNFSSNRASYDTNTGHSYESQSPFWKRLVAIALAREKATNK
ncbi:hypothetical protein L914_06642, partial [Phytophthora nicotianae]